MLLPVSFRTLHCTVVLVLEWAFLVEMCCTLSIIVCVSYLLSISFCTLACALVLGLELASLVYGYTPQPAILSELLCILGAEGCAVYTYSEGL